MARKKATPAEDITTLDAPVDEPAIEGEVITDPAEQAPEPTTALVVAEPVAVETTDEKALRKRLSAIANSIRKEVGKGIEAAFTTGHLLSEARELLRGDAEFGRWFREQELGISQPTANRLRWAAENEPAVREALAHSARNGRDIGVPTAVKELTARADEEGRVPKDVQKRVAELFEDEPTVTSGLPAFKEAAAGLNLQVLTSDELVEFASIVQTLVAQYGEERKRRTA